MKKVFRYSLKVFRYSLKILNPFIWFINWFMYDSYYFHESPMGPPGSYNFDKDLKYF